MIIRNRLVSGAGVAIVLSLLAGGLTPVAAAAATTPQPERPVQVDDGTSTEATPANKAAKLDKRRYCIVETPTGSRISNKVCHTKAEWFAQGIDIDNPDA